MSNDLLFHPLPSSTRAALITLWVNGQPVQVPHGWTLAAALLAHGVIASRTSALDNQPRGPFCLMGVCFECRVTVDDVPNVQSCITPVRAGMRVTLPQGVIAS